MNLSAIVALFWSLRTNHWVILIAGTLNAAAVFWLAKGGANPIIPSSIPFAGGAGLVTEIVVVSALLAGSPLANNPIASKLAAWRAKRASRG